MGTEPLLFCFIAICCDVLLGQKVKEPNIVQADPLHSNHEHKMSDVSHSTSNDSNPTLMLIIGAGVLMCCFCCISILFRCSCQRDAGSKNPILNAGKVNSNPVMIAETSIDSAIEHRDSHISSPSASLPYDMGSNHSMTSVNGLEQSHRFAGMILFMQSSNVNCSSNPLNITDEGIDIQNASMNNGTGGHNINCDEVVDIGAQARELGDQASVDQQHVIAPRALLQEQQSNMTLSNDYKSNESITVSIIVEETDKNEFRTDPEMNFVNEPNNVDNSRIHQMVSSSSEDDNWIIECRV